jgi:hypothetical protein
MLGLGRANLIAGNTDTDRWVGATVRINPTLLVGAR